MKTSTPNEQSIALIDTELVTDVLLLTTKLLDTNCTRQYESTEFLLALMIGDRCRTMIGEVYAA
jgi:hypothetical protein